MPRLRQAGETPRVARQGLLTPRLPATRGGRPARAASTPGGETGLSRDWEKGLAGIDVLRRDIRAATHPRIPPFGHGWSHRVPPIQRFGLRWSGLTTTRSGFRTRRRPARPGTATPAG